MEIHERIKQRRKSLDLTADAVADALGISRATIYRYESADIEKMPITILEPLAKVLKCTPAYLMGWEDNSQLAQLQIDGLDEKENTIIENYRQLNDFGKDDLLRRSDELIRLGYTKDD